MCVRRCDEKCDVFVPLNSWSVKPRSGEAVALRVLYITARRPQNTPLNFCKVVREKKKYNTLYLDCLGRNAYW